MAVLLPIVGLLISASILVSEKRQVVVEMSKLKELASFAPTVSALVHELQKERGVSAGFIGSEGMRFVSRLEAQRILSDARHGDLVSILEEAHVAPFGDALVRKVRAVHDALDMLVQVRKDVANLKLSTPQMAEFYIATIAKLIGITEELAVLSTNARVSNNITAYTNFMQGKERAGVERALGTAGFAAGQFSPIIHRRFLQLIATQKAFFGVFKANATERQRAFYRDTMRGPAVNEVERMRKIAIESPEAKTTRGVKGPKWFDAITRKIDLMKKVEDKIAADLLALADKIEGDARNAFLTMLGATAVLFLFIVFIVMFIVRSITKPLSQVTANLGRLACGDKSFEVEGVHRGDEIGAIAKAVDVFKGIMIKLEDSQKDMQNKTDQMFKLAKSYKGQKELAEASNKSKSEFLATMSHEIRTPMTGVIGLADIMLDCPTSVEQREHINKIKSSTLSLLTIINDILDLSKLDANKMELEEIDFHIADMTADVVELVRLKAGEKGVSLEMHIADGLQVGANGDPIRIRQILVNLIGNAVKFTDKGYVKVEVSAMTESEKPMLRFAVSDTGIGVDEDNIDELFNDFTQADTSTSRKYEGSGLGLAISRRLVNLMGGKIGAESKLAEGSTFWFTAPLKPTISDVAASRKKKTATEYRATRALNILLAEDNKLNQKIICAIVGKYGHRTDVVENGAEAVDACREGDYDLILMDVRMPEMNGPDATREIRNFGNGKSSIPIIAVTADAMADHQKQYFSAGMDACVTKPVDKGNILETINQVIGEEIHVAVEVEPDDKDGAGASAKEYEKTEDEKKETTAKVDDFLKRMQDIANSLDGEDAG